MRAGWRLAGCLAAVLVAAGCAPVHRGAPPAVDVTGVWEGEWQIAGVARGSLAMTLVQRAAEVAGEVALTLGQGLQGGPIEGRVSGSTFTFRGEGGFAGEATVEGGRMTGQARATQIARIVLRRVR
jgi:hypothetical protein